jgi:DNA replication protein DnaC
VSTSNEISGQLSLLLRSFRVTGFAENYQVVADQAEKARLSYEGFLYELAKVEAEERRVRRIQRLKRQSRLPPDKKIDTFDLDRVPTVSKRLVGALCEGGFLDSAENVLAFGNPGTGKSHLLWGIGNALVERGRSVLNVAAFALVQRLLVAKRDLRLPEELKRLDRFECLLVDDLGYVQHRREEMDVLFTLFAERYERRSVMISSNLVFSKWDQIFKDPMTTTAAIDRLVHHAHILELNVKSYRAEEAEERKGKKTKGTNRARGKGRSV